MSDTGPPPLHEAALIVPVPEAEPWVGELRQLYDPSAAVGVPAHITVNYPFTPHLGRPLEARLQLAALLSGFRQFSFALCEICTFPGVIYLAPEPEAPFVALAEAVASLFPDSPPYEGRFADFVPHLTVAQVDETAVAAVMTEVSERVSAVLPVPCQALHVMLIDNSDTVWKSYAVFPLRPS